MQTRIFEIVPSPLTFDPIEEYKDGKTRRRERRKKLNKRK
jgi:hypothetical protein